MAAPLDHPEPSEAAHDSPNRDGAPVAAEGDLKAKFREALERKQANDRGVDHKGHGKQKPPETHGPLGGAKMHRRKAGGGGA